jgi:hypothetical protein
MDMSENHEKKNACEARTRIESVLAPLQKRLVAHPLYAALRDERSVRVFMEAHVFAVWDFQSLLKALQRTVTCVDVPWLPTADPEARRLVNEIVLDEESDLAPAGGHLSHFEIYLQAMRECGADTSPIESFIARLRSGLTLEDAFDSPAIPPGVAPFVQATLAIARCGEPHRIAAAFAYGREEVIPAMFQQIIARLAAASPCAWDTLRYYLERHIGRDAEQHGPQADRLARKLCGDDATRWLQATEAARTSLEARVNLWDAVADTVSRCK